MASCCPRCRTCLTLEDRKSTRLNSSHLVISYAVFCLKKKKKNTCSPRCIICSYIFLQSFRICREGCSYCSHYILVGDTIEDLLLTTSILLSPTYRRYT